MTWLRFVRSEATGESTADPHADAIGDRNVRVPQATRALTDSRRANGRGTEDASVATRPAAPEQPIATTDDVQVANHPADPEVAAAGTRTPAPAPPTAALVTAAKGTRTPTPAPSTTAIISRAPVAPRDTPVDAPRAVAVLSPPPPRRTVAMTSPSPPLTTVAPIAEAPLLPSIMAQPPGPPARPLPPRELTGVPGEVVQPAPDDAALDGPTTDAHAWSDLGVANEDVPLGEATRVGVRDDPLGRWMVVLDDTLRGLWVYPPRLRALGVEGTVILRFRVRRNGVIDQIIVVRSGGNIELDRAALASVPARTLPLPPETEARSLEIRYTFRYRGGTTDLANGSGK